MRILLRDHVQSEKMANLCPVLGGLWDEDGPPLLHVLLEKSKHRSDQGQACLALAERAENRLLQFSEFKDNPDWAKRLYEPRIGKEGIEALAKASPEKLSAEAEAYYERVVKEFADVTDLRGKKLGDEAKRSLDKLRHPILVSKPAPEIEGEDIDGVKFKLSDYRGKVVLLNSWGHW